MKAAVYSGNKQIKTGEGLVVPPDKKEVRLEVAYCGICGTDMHIYHGHLDKRVKIPHIIGHEVSGRIVEVGEEVSGYALDEIVSVRPLKAGDLVSSDKGFAHISQNLEIIGVDLPGGMQASWTLPAYTLHKLPPSISLQHGSMIEPLAVACHDVRLGKVRNEEYVIVIGGGPIGILIALVSKSKGAKVMVSEINPHRIALAETLGFATVNPEKQSLVQTVAKYTSGHMADLVFEVSGSLSGVEAMTQLANKRGRIVMVAIHPQAVPVDLYRLFLSELQLIGARVYEKQDFDEAIDLAASEKIPFDHLIAGVYSIDNVQQIFETIEKHPQGMKYLIDCQT